MQEKTFLQNIKFKIPVFLVSAVIIWIGAGKVGFPIWWQIEFVAFAFVGLLFFILLDLPAMKPEKSQKHSVFRLICTYTTISVLLIVMTAQLPQFDPELELEKLNRPPVKLEGLAGPEVIAAGREVFEIGRAHV